MYARGFIASSTEELVVTKAGCVSVALHLGCVHIIEVHPCSVLAHLCFADIVDVLSFFGTCYFGRHIVLR